MNLTPNQLAERLHCRLTTLAMWRVRGTGPRFIKAGRKVLYPLVEVEKWEAENLHKNTAA